MESDAYFERLLASLAASYDVVRDAQIVSRRVDALAQLRALNSKYVLSKKHVLWEANAYDHALILRVQTLTAAMVEDWFTFLTREAEPELVEPEAARAVRRAKFSKSYRFSLRGWATGRAAAADLGGGCVYASRDAKDLERHLLALMRAQ